ncbi:MAG: ADP-ribosylglycohydrolase family protein [Armatimonadota bacterium]|nr:ADP-ribosylglycohydrolase family protein [bacterium]
MQQADNILQQSITGCILGTAVGDAIGLPYEGIPKRRLQKLKPPLDRHRFLFGRGMVSDDTEHTCMVAQAVAASAGDVDEFSRILSSLLKTWLLSVPAGTGMATARAIAKLLVGFPIEKSGVFSAGNGPAMRSAIIGVCFGNDPDRMRSLVRASTRITHTDPKAELGALAVAAAAYYSTAHHAEDDVPAHYLEYLSDLVSNESGSNELLNLIAKAAASANAGETTASFAAAMGWEKGISGYIYATVPAVLHAWFRHPDDYASAITGLIECGGDTDTTAAIAGAIVGAGVGVEGIPDIWLQELMEWPCSVVWMEKLGRQLYEVINGGIAQKPIRPAAPFVLARNAFFLAVVLGHGFRRLLPPY